MAFNTELPTLVPSSADAFLDSMRAEPPGLYLLGSLNRHITVHSQQCRAINLIAALMQGDDQLHKKSIAIVGAGFAGLTAAAYALDKTNATVTLFESAPRPLWLQDGCANRWLHPRIYDWPRPGSLEPRTDLPVLNWRAGSARNVARLVRAEWERIAATKRTLTTRLNTTVTAVTSTSDGRIQIDTTAGSKETFDIVVLAVGFGMERGGPGRVGYWNDADDLEEISEGASVLVCGFGDGGLADVLRLCLPSIGQDSLIELVRDVSVDDRRKLVEWEERYQSNHAALNKEYEQLRVDELIKVFKDHATSANVTLAGQGHLYGSRSAILNRFLISQLRHAYIEKKKDSFELITDSIDETSLTNRPDGRREIRIADRNRVFDHIVLRFGPSAVFGKIAPLANWKVAKERATRWKELPQSLDQTRVPIWQPVATGAASESGRQDFLAYESSSRPWCLVVHPPPSPTVPVDWATHTRVALKGVAKEIASLNPVPLTLTSVDAFKNAITTGDAVRALCVADIVIADVTGYDPSVLLLLGIRAAVRRGVTIACTTQELSQLLWKELPFNLKELNLISFHNQDEGHANLLSAILLGLRQSGVSPRYLDLPVYDYVREDTGGGAANDPYRVLLLRAFDSGSGSSQIIYGGARKALINDGIREARSLPASATIETVIDQVSPRLAGQRLYEAIRHWQTCVVDLTWWRANVLFELGVRLAVQAKGTYCFIDESEEPGQTYRGSRALLKELLKPFRYDRTTQNFSEAFLAPVAPLIYDAAARHFRREQDRFNDDVDKMLLEAAAVAPGDDPLQAIDLAPLYARDNQEYGAALKQSVFERLCAAWMYLAGRNRPDTFRPIDLLDPHRAAVFQAFFRLGSRLKAVIALRREDRDRWLQGEIERSEGDARKSGASEMAALLAEWDGIRRGNPLWRIERATIKDGGWDDLVDDCEHQIEQLSRLRFELRSLDNSVCEMPLQGIESNLRHLKIALGRFQRRDP